MTGPVLPGTYGLSGWRCGQDQGGWRHRDRDERQEVAREKPRGRLSFSFFEGRMQKKNLNL